tara:strand:- start:287 stop:544 length:258 start_codon:yes stop_codon:yes gene_type:complete
MKFEEKKDLLFQLSPDVIVADGFEDALIGVGQQFNKALAVYDRQKCIEILMERDGMSDEEAVEFFEYNVTGAWVGEYTPIFLETF